MKPFRALIRESREGFRLLVAWFIGLSASVSCVSLPCELFRIFNRGRVGAQPTTRRNYFYYCP